MANQVIGKHFQILFCKGSLKLDLNCLTVKVKGIRTVSFMITDSKSGSVLH